MPSICLGIYIFFSLSGLMLLEETSNLLTINLTILILIIKSIKKQVVTNCIYNHKVLRAIKKSRKIKKCELSIEDVNTSYIAQEEVATTDMLIKHLEIAQITEGGNLSIIGMLITVTADKIAKEKSINAVENKMNILDNDKDSFNNVLSEIYSDEKVLKDLIISLKLNDLIE